LANQISTNCAKFIVDQMYDILHPAPTILAGAANFDYNAAFGAHVLKPEFEEARQIVEQPLEDFILHIRILAGMRKAIPKPNASEAEKYAIMINDVKILGLLPSQSLAEWHTQTYEHDTLALKDTHREFTAVQKLNRGLHLIAGERNRWSEFHNEIVRTGGLQEAILAAPSGPVQDGLISNLWLNLFERDRQHWLN
jgi:hypothetical protein